MKRCLGLILFIGALVYPVFAQTGFSGPTRVEVRNQYYDVISDGGSYDAETLCRELELRFEVYNRLFRFNVNELSAPLRVVAFTDKNAYDSYVMAKLGSTRDGAVYLHYNQPDRRELVIHRGSLDEDRVLPHQAFIQYLRAFIPYPPTWLREGFAIYFNSLKFDKDSRELRYEENLAWLETVKNLGSAQPSLDAVFLADSRGTPENFQPISWALVSFFLNSGGNGEYFRSLTESFMILAANKSAGDNSQAVLGRLTSWTDLGTMRNDYLAYIQSRKTFAELVDAGQKAYTAKDLQAAESFFLAALYQKPTHFAPYYYLGLLAYEDANYDMAERYYRSALQYGADSALVNYALGINAATAGRNEEAVAYLQAASIESPDRYKERAENIIIRLK